MPGMFTPYPSAEGGPAAGFDWLDGSPQVGGGTLTPPSLVLPTISAQSPLPQFQAGTLTYLESTTDSPEIERAEQATIRQSFYGDWGTCVFWNQTIGRGYIMQDTYGFSYKVLSCKIQRLPGGGLNKASLVIIAESISFDPPPDEFDVDPYQVNFPIFWHPRYINPPFGSTYGLVGYNLNASGNQVDTTQWTGYQIMANVQIAANSPQVTARDEGTINITAKQINDPNILSLALELIQKLRKGNSEYYLSGWNVYYTQHSFVPWNLNPGGYIEDPVLSGNLPWYFWSNDLDLGDASNTTTNNIFLAAAHAVDPQLYPTGTPADISWLRMADKQRYSRTIYTLTSSWAGAPLGMWDKQLYAPAGQVPGPGSITSAP
jgi:hypothetical protein